MSEIISILFFLIGLGLSWLMLPWIVKNNAPYSRPLVAILFLFLWNSEYMAASIFVFAILYYLKEVSSENPIKLEAILSHLLYIMVFTFIFRKLKDASMQYLIEINLQNIK
jgi:hypothetical protein